MEKNFEFAQSFLPNNKPKFRKGKHGYAQQCCNSAMNYWCCHMLQSQFRSSIFTTDRSYKSL